MSLPLICCCRPSSLLSSNLALGNLLLSVPHFSLLQNMSTGISGYALPPSFNCLRFQETGCPNSFRARKSSRQCVNDTPCICLAAVRLPSLYFLFGNGVYLFLLKAVFNPETWVLVLIDQVVILAKVRDTEHAREAKLPESSGIPCSEPLFPGALEGYNATVEQLFEILH